ncbi:hypothetical protein [Bacillus licheniformis]|uniref:hypothetical protein n=1 Tax=Bacillus licheniformis TaxID=1402 RepID=UPI001BA770F2|nr:hypothetical protein [Bacillus licheniformis]MBS2764276.1 hypothetical protein [Bacillus licheniformis]
MHRLDENQIHEFAIAVVNSTSVEGDSPESVVQKKLELYVEAIRQATALTVKLDKAENKKYEQYYESEKFRI